MNTNSIENMSNSIKNHNKVIQNEDQLYEDWIAKENKKVKTKSKLNNIGSNFDESNKKVKKKNKAPKTIKNPNKWVDSNILKNISKSIEPFDKKEWRSKNFDLFEEHIFIFSFVSHFLLIDRSLYIYWNHSKEDDKEIIC